MPSLSTRRNMLGLGCTVSVLLAGFTPGILNSSAAGSPKPGGAASRTAAPLSSPTSAASNGSLSTGVPTASTSILTKTSGSAAPATTASTTSSAGGGLRFGLTYPEILPAMDAATLGRYLDDAVSLGVTWIRFDLPWDMVQPNSASSSDWSAIDRVVNAANARHLSLLPIVQYTPGWARPSSCTGSDHCAPA